MNKFIKVINNNEAAATLVLIVLATVGWMAWRFVPSFVPALAPVSDIITDHGVVVAFVGTLAAFGLLSEAGVIRHRH